MHTPVWGSVIMLTVWMCECVSQCSSVPVVDIFLAVTANQGAFFPIRARKST